MKKLLLTLLSLVFVFSLFSCDTEEVSEKPSETVTENTDKVQSASTEKILKKDDLTAALDKLWTDTFGDEKDVPDGLIAEKVRSLSTANYTSSKKEFDNYCRKAEGRLKSILSELPERCVMKGERETGNFASPHVSTFYVLDSAAVSDPSSESLRNYLVGRVDDIIAGDEYISTETDKEFEDIGTVAVHYHGIRWYWFDTATNEAEPIELFPDFTEIKQMYINYMSDRVKEEYEKIIAESVTE